MKEARLTKRASVALDNYVVDCVWSSDSAAVAIAGGEGAVFLVTDACANPEVRTLGTHARARRSSGGVATGQRHNRILGSGWHGHALGRGLCRASKGT